MNKLTGIDTAQKIRAVDQDTIIIYTTGDIGPQMDSFLYCSFDYLMKSSEPEDIFKTMDHILRIHTEKDSKKFSFICDHRPLILCYSDIVCLEAIDNYILIHDSRDLSYKTRRTYSSVEHALSQEPRFLKVNRSIIINMDYIEKITDKACHLKGGLLVPVDQKKSRALQQIRHNYNSARIHRNASKKG